MNKYPVILGANSGDYNFESPLFVPFGAYCWPAEQLRTFEIRQAAFPLDWMITPYDFGIIKLLDRNFEDFSNEKYLIHMPDRNIAHTLYNFKFLRDHLWGASYGDDKVDVQRDIEQIQSIHQKRIERIKKLDFFIGKVAFIRKLLPSRFYKKTCPNTYWFDYSHEKNEEEVSRELYNALKRRFSNLNFELIIICKTEQSERMEMIGNVPLFYIIDDSSHNPCFMLFNYLKSKYDDSENSSK